MTIVDGKKKKVEDDNDERKKYMQILGRIL